MDFQVPNIPSGGVQPPEFDPAVVEKIFSAQVPTQQDVLNYIYSAHWAQGIAMLVLGIVYLLWGWKAFKMLVIVNSALCGAMIGVYLGSLHGGRNMTIICGGSCAVGLVLVSLPFMKYAVSVMSGFVGAFIGYTLWSRIAGAVADGQLAQHAWVGGLVGLIVLGMLAFIALKITIVVFTSVQGAVMSVGGLMIMASKFSAFREGFEDHVHGNAILVPLIVLVPAVVGFAFQYAALHKKQLKKAKAAEGGDS